MRKIILISTTIGVVILCLGGTGIATEKFIKERVKSTSPKKVEKIKSLTHEEALEQMRKEDIGKFSPKVLSLIERVKKKMNNKTLCPPDREDMDILYLGISRDSRAIPILIKVIKNYEGRGARVQAIKALGMIEDKSAIPILEEVLEESLKNKDIWMTLKTIHSLCNIDINAGLKHLSILINILKNDIRIDDKQEVLDILAKIGNKEAIIAIKEALEDENKETRYFAIYALRDIKDKKGIFYIKEALSSKHKDVQENAQKILKEIEQIQK